MTSIPYKIKWLLLLCFLSVQAFAQEKAGLNKTDTYITDVFSKVQDGNYSALIKNDQTIKHLLKWKLYQECPDFDQFSKNNPKFARNFVSDVEWMEGFLGSGLMKNGDIALKMLAMLCDHDPQMPASKIYKKLATASALEYAKRRYKPDKDEKAYADDAKEIKDRYDYYKESHLAGLLNRQFDQLDYWDMRIITGRMLPELQTAKWLRDNYRLPANQYTGVCWICPYRLHNIWGDSIHGSDYFKTFNGLFKGGWAQMIRDVGGVCGSLSTFGAQAALSNGLPASNMGEPAHCAYMVRITKDQWAPAYSLSWKRGVPIGDYKGTWAFLLIWQDAYSDTVKMRESNYLSWAAKVLKTDQKGKAKELYLAAVKNHPLHCGLWDDFFAWEEGVKELTAEQLKEFSGLICKVIAPKYSEVAWDMLNEKIYPLLMPKLNSVEERLAVLKEFHEQLGDNMTPIHWDYEKALAQQMTHLNAGDKGLIPFVSILSDTHLNSNGYSSPSLIWSYNEASKFGVESSFFELIAGKEKGTKGSNNAVKNLANTIAQKSEESGDINAFQTVGKLMKEHFKPSLPDFEAFPGELLSSGGVIKLSSINGRYGEPWRHWGVLENCGGFLHTNNEENSFVTVTLPRTGELSGIVLVMDKNENRGNNSIIEVSMDGNTWTEVAKIDKMEKVQRVDLQSASPKAQYVRVTRKGKEFYNLNAILIYGKKSA